MKVVDATADLVPALLARMEPERRALLEERAGCVGLEAGIIENLARSPVTWAGLDEHGVVALGGVMRDVFPDGIGFVWQFANIDGISANKRAYLRMARAKMAEALTHFDRLRTVIVADRGAELRHWIRNGGTVGATQIINGILACVCERSASK